MSASRADPGAIEPHGGDLDAWSLRLDRPVEDLIDFSICLNPLGPPRAAIRAARDSLARWAGRYPAPAALGVRDALARFHEVAPESVVVGAGASDLIWRMARHAGRTRSVVLGPTFGEYARAVQAAGGAVDHVPLASAPDLAPPAALGWLCQPNSPGGEHHEPDSLARWVGWARACGATLVIDESFAELAWPPVESLVPTAAVEPGLVVVRSLTKTYACPWLRMGYAVAHPALASALTASAPPWCVSGAAQAFALAALGEASYLERSRRAVARRRAELARVLEASGITPSPSRGPFLSGEVGGGGTARDVQLRLARDHGIIVRHCGSFVGLEGTERLRFGLRSRADIARLRAALGETR